MRGILVKSLGYPLKYTPMRSLRAQSELGLFFGHPGRMTLVQSPQL